MACRGGESLRRSGYCGSLFGDGFAPFGGGGLSSKNSCFVRLIQCRFSMVFVHLKTPPPTSHLVKRKARVFDVEVVPLHMFDSQRTPFKPT